MFTPGQHVACINDNFHPSLVEWTDQFPRKGRIYTVTAVRQDAPDAVTRKPGIGIFLAEVPSCDGRLCFSAWRFKAVDAPSHAAENEELETAPLAFTSETCAHDLLDTVEHFSDTLRYFCRAGIRTGQPRARGRLSPGKPVIVRTLPSNNSPALQRT
jgi:hypothetical protein